MVESRNHPDVHRLGPEGPGGLTSIGQVRALATELALLPVEGGARVAIIEAAHRLTEDAQHALLKTLEEPPAGVTIVLCADDEDRLLATVRSRCARVRLGPVGSREVEELLGSLGLADAPTAARLARLAVGRPGLAIAYARAPEAAAARGQVSRILIDLLDGGPAARLRAARELSGTADAALGALAAGQPAVGPTDGGRGRRARPATEPEALEGEPADGGTRVRASASDRRRAAAWLVDAWVALARDLAVVAAGDRSRVRDPGLLDELTAASARLAPGVATAFLGRLAHASAALEVNASPELVLDVLLLAWPGARATAAGG
jgi:DNA polymerase-3 subunit delta'